jgi:hypothetical protein
MATIIYLIGAELDPERGAITVSEAPAQVTNQWDAAGAKGILALTQLSPERAITLNRNAVAWWAEDIED